jgi:hypothetical protein
MSFGVMYPIAHANSETVYSAMSIIDSAAV